MTRPLASPVAPAVAVLALVVVPVDGGLRRQRPGRRRRRDHRRRVHRHRVHGVRGQAPAGTITFKVKNTGDEVTEFYLLGDGRRCGSSARSRTSGPGLTRDLVVQAAPAAYFTACKPGMVGDGIRSAVHASPAPAAPLARGRLDAAARRRRGSVRRLRSRARRRRSSPAPSAFAEAYAAGDDDAARDLYAATRVHWESIEPVAESFGDLDPLLDPREADLAEGDAWSGWHLIEKDLWPPAPDANGGTRTCR